MGGSDSRRPHQGGMTMTLSRRTLLSLATSAAALPVASRLALAQAYPARPVHLLVGFGAGSNIAAEAVTRAPADGYTLLLATSTNAVNTTLYQHLSFNFSTDIVPVALIDLVPYVLEVTPSLPAKTLPEYITYAKANPGKINMASNGIGSGPHVAGELFKMMAGVDLVHVPYTGNVYPDLMGGQVQVMFSPIPASIGFVRAGQLRPLAVGTAKRLTILPDVPTVAEVVPGYEASGWHGIGAPANTPAEIVDKLNAAIN